MAQIANVSLTHEVKLFGHRAWELGSKIESDAAHAPVVESLRQAVAEVPRRLTRAAASEGRRETHELHFAFRALTRAVEILDRLGREKNELAVDALALAQEGAELTSLICERVA